MKAALDVSIIIVNYNTKELTRNCLRSVFDQTKDVDFEVIVSDNGSTDGSIEMIRAEFPQAILIENNANLGFGAANNRGLKIARGKYVFYLNSDTVLLNNAVKLFFDYWESSPEKDQIGALGCVLQDEEGRAIHSGGKFPTYGNVYKSLFSRFLASYGIKKENFGFIMRNDFDYTAVEYITGADNFLLNNSDACFDERYFMYFEESDLQYQLKKKGKQILLLTEPKIIHLGAGSSEDKDIKVSKYNFSTKSAVFYWASCFKYMMKNFYYPSKIKLLKKILLFIYSQPRNKSFFELFKSQIFN